MKLFKQLLKKYKTYVVYSTNHDKLMNDECKRVCLVDAKDDKEMFAILNRMKPVNPNDFLIFEEVLDATE